MEVMLRHNENLKVVEEEHEQLKIAFAEQSQRSVLLNSSREQGPILVGGLLCKLIVSG